MASFPHASVPTSLQEDEQAASFLEDARLILKEVQILGNGIFWRAGNGSPEGVVTARPGSLFSRLDGPPTLYVKQTGVNTSSGWVAK